MTGSVNTSSPTATPDTPRDVGGDVPLHPRGVGGTISGLPDDLTREQAIAVGEALLEEIDRLTAQ